MIVREAIIVMLQKGLPVTMAVTGGLYGNQRHGKPLATAGYTAGGFLLGWLAQRLFFDAMEHASGAALPTKEAPMGALPAPQPQPRSKTNEAVNLPQPEIGKPADDFKPPKSGNGTTVVYHDTE